MSRRKKILIGVIIAQILLGIGLVYYFFILEPKINLQKNKSIKRSPLIRKPRGNEAGGTIVGHDLSSRRNLAIGFISILWILILVFLYSLSRERTNVSQINSGFDEIIRPGPIGAKEGIIPENIGDYAIPAPQVRFCKVSTIIYIIINLILLGIGLVYYFFIYLPGRN